MRELAPAPAADGVPPPEQHSAQSCAEEDGLPEEPVLVLPSLVAAPPPEPSERDEEEAEAEAQAPLIQLPSPREEPASPQEAPEGSFVEECECEPAPALLEAAEAARALGAGAPTGADAASAGEAGEGEAGAGAAGAPAGVIGSLLGAEIAECAAVDAGAVGAAEPCRDAPEDVEGPVRPCRVSDPAGTSERAPPLEAGLGARPCDADARREGGAREGEAREKGAAADVVADMGAAKAKVQTLELELHAQANGAPGLDSSRSPRGAHAAPPTNRWLLCYARHVGKYPCAFIAAYALFLVVLVAAAWRPLALEEDFDAFIRADGHAMRNREAYLTALTEQKDLKNSRRLAADRPLDLDGERIWLEEEGEGEAEGGAEAAAGAGAEARGAGAPEGRRLGPAMLYVRKSLMLVHVAVAGDALDERVLREVRDFELRLRSLPEWRRLCHERVTSPGKTLRCDPGETLAALAWPSRTRGNRSGVLFEARFDAVGLDLLPQPAMLEYMRDALAHGDVSRDPRRFFPKDYSLPLPGPAQAAPPSALRTKYEFHILVGYSGQSMAVTKRKMAEAAGDYDHMLKQKVYPMLTENLEQYKHIRTYYSGDTLDGYEVSRTLMLDLSWAGGSIAFVTLYMWLHTRSLVVSLSSLFMVFASIPVAYVLTPASKTTIASFLSLFLITGLGSDVVFVFTDFWAQGAHLEDTTSRVAFLVLHAGKACLATSLTTSVSFFANLASVLQPLREFGMFMGLCVMGAFLLVLLFLPPVLVLVERRRRRVDRRVVDISSGENGTLAVMPEAPAPAGPCPCWRPGRRRAKGRSCTRLCLLRLVACTARCPVLLLVCTLLCLFVFVVGVATGVRLEKGVPEIFPPEHNQVAGKAAAGRFGALDMAAATAARGVVCGPEERNAATTPERCMFHLCEVARPAAAAAAAAAAGGGLLGTCWHNGTLVHERGAWRQASHGLERCRDVVAEVRAALPREPSGAWQQEFVGAIGQGLQAVAGRGLQSTLSGQRYFPALEALALQDWETGSVQVSPFFRTVMHFLSTASAAPSPGPVEASCKVRTMCFFGVPRCSLPGWQPLGSQMNLTEVQPRLLADAAPPAPAPPAPAPPPAPAVQALLPRHRRVDVTVLFGLRPARSTPLVGAPTEHWSFDPGFEPSNPWAQRAVLAMCTGLPSELRVVESDCFIGHFRAWLTAQGKRFPSRDFDADLVQWYTSDPVVGQRTLWMVDRKVKACRLGFMANFANDASAQAVAEYAKHWDAFLELRNAAASVTANQAWHTARSFVRAEAEVAIIESTFATILISAGCGMLGMLVFTQEPVLAVIVLALVLEITCGLAFFMVTVMQWAVGAIEVLSLVVFVGYSVTYALHIAHHYSDARPDDPELLELEAQEERAHPGGGGSARPLRLSGRAPRRSSVASASAAPRASTASAASAAAGAPLAPAKLRVARVRLALARVGGATLSSAVSTVGSAAFLLGCTLNIFGKLGSVVMAVTLLSITFALVALPAVLVLLGPGPDPCYVRLPRLAAARLAALLCGRGRGAGGQGTQREPLMPS